MRTSQFSARGTAVHAQLGVNASKFEAWENHTDGTVSPIAHRTVTQPYGHTFIRRYGLLVSAEGQSDSSVVGLTSPCVNEPWGAGKDHQPTV